MKILHVLVIGLAMVTMYTMHGMQQGPTVGQDILYGVGTGAASLGIFYGAQSYLNETEGRALALSTLGGIVISAVLQASAAGKEGDWLATVAAATVTFGLTKYIYEQNQVPATTQDQGTTAATV
jgi:hypothetical protein